MPPQPLTNKRYPPGINIVIDAGSLARRPLLTPYIIRVLAFWPFLESQLGTLWVAILGPDASNIIVRFIGRASTNRYLEMLLEAARLHLAPEDMKSLQVVMNMFISVSEMRNRIAHWMCAVSNQIPDGILYINPHDHWRFLIEQNLRRDRTFKRKIPELNRKKIFVYETSSFEEICSEMRVLQKCMSHLHMIFVASKSDPHSSISTGARDLLFAIPQFQEALAVLSARADSKKPKSLRQRLARLQRQLSQAFREFFQAR